MWEEWLVKVTLGNIKKRMDLDRNEGFRDWKVFFEFWTLKNPWALNLKPKHNQKQTY